MFDVEFARSHFPALSDDWALCDIAGGSVPLAGVIERVRDYMSRWQVQLGATYPHSATATAMVAEGRRAMARLVKEKVLTQEETAKCYFSVVVADEALILEHREGARREAAHPPRRTDLSLPQ